MINIKTYKKLVLKLNSINYFLKKLIFAESSPWLNLIRAHPSVLEEYYNLFNLSKNSNINKINNRSLFNYFKKYLSEIFSSSKFNYTNKIKEIDIMIISNHNFDKNLIEDHRDFYFSDLQKFFEKHNFNSLLVLRNLNKTPNIKYKAINDFKNSSKVILPIRNNIILEIKYILILLYTKFILIFFNFKNAFSNKIINTFSSIKILSKSIKNLRNYDQFYKLLKKHKPKYIITTYEGHAWEFLLFKVVKLFNPNIFIIAYQYSVLVKFQNNMYKLKNRRYLPDLICTSGKVNQEVLTKYYSKYNIPVIIIGNNIGFKNQKFFSDLNYKSKISNKCLIVPEGITSEIKIMINFTIKYVNKYKNNIVFYIKSHPSYNKNFYEKNFNISKFKNIEFVLDDDFNICDYDYFIHRGTSLAINLVSQGIKQIYLKSSDNIDINPFFKIENECTCISDISELHKILSNNIKNNNVLIKFSNNYFEKLDFSKLLSVLINNNK